MTQEVLKLALEALAGLKDVEKQVRELVAENKALKEALTQPEQEPVACIEYIPCCTDKTCPKCKATTPPQRPWVGLTDAEIGVIDEATWDEDHKSWGIHDFARAIEAKLKEKNGA